MSLDKAIEHGKEKRKPYYGRKASYGKNCRNHGSCERCKSDRLHSSRKREARVKNMLFDGTD